jgi:cyclophilin family peptidyl-prolyl cis-trans isomerase
MYPSIPDSGGSRFLITKQPRPDFQGKLTVFGRVIEGLENLYKIQIVDKTRSIDSGVKPTVINRITVLRKRDHEYTPEKLLGTPAGVGK